MNQTEPFIGIDGNEANVMEPVGSNVYALRLLTGLNTKDTATHYRVYIKSPTKPRLPKNNSHWQYASFGPGLLWTQWRLPLQLYLDNLKPKLFFSPCHYAPRFCPVPSVISIMDLAYLK